MNATMPPRVSIVIPFLNSEHFLAEAIESVLAQTYTSWELILVDDGSSDGSTNIARGFVERTPTRIRCIEHPNHGNRGTAASRNLGILNSQGEYIANLDHDDIWTKTKLEAQVRILDHNPMIAMTFGPMMLWHSWKCIKNEKADRIQQFTFRTNQVIEPPTFVSLLLTGKNDPHGYLMRRSAFEDVGGYEEDVGICEDWGLYLKIALRHQIFVSANYNYCYRQHSDQICSIFRRSGRLYSEFIPFFNWLETYLSKVGCDDRDVKQAVTEAIRRNRFDRLLERSTYRVRTGLRRALGSV